MLLKNFADEHKYIHLYDRGKNVFRSKISYLSQCQKDYFYGNTKDVENFLGEFETIIENIIQKLLQSKNTKISLSIDEYRILSMFVVSQYLRTQGKMERTAYSLDDFRQQVKKIITQFHCVYEHDETDEQALERLVPQIEKKEITRNNVRIAFESHIEYSDLAVLIINNQTNMDFIVSDDPVIEKNFYYPRKGFGLASIGILYFLPISPKQALMLIDEVAYFKPNTITPFIDIKDELDILKLNTWQFAKSNLLFSLDEKSLKTTVERNLHYKKNNILFAKKYIEADIAIENPFLSLDIINKKAIEILENEDGFNNAINDYVDEDNIPSFLYIYAEIRRQGRKQYWNIPLRKDYK